ncbi:MAG: hydroxymethylglutaryl-CoA reductase, degradative [Caldilineaceae bacterium SB0675_bin_29]|uniref:3-hydroxy-3-methylglutaryl coenzyme A reductase n=1 Tax=Caldilineaceae bacterium SB0675_bin_29 TaxID=2605266 RepID=A0A6B1G2X4_9CHLR|nr:hydroxymethylglutaryl-CoA reductase, degradative [Caldilineaceae bacterium SB0675_bin_29]
MAGSTEGRSSRIEGFYRRSLEDRIGIISEWAGLTCEETAVLAESIGAEQADKMVENVVGRFSMPLGIGANFLIDGRDYLIPMAVEEPSVVAGASSAALLARAGVGFKTGCTDPIMIAQIQLLDVADASKAKRAILASQEKILACADTSPTISQLGGGPQGMEVRYLPDTEAGPMLIVHLFIDCRDAMGANAANTAAEAAAPLIEQISGGRAGLRILSNLSDRRRAWAEVEIAAKAFDSNDYSGREVIRGIAEANAFAIADPYRATTHNKGIFNGVDAVLLATGNDWRAVEAGAHAWAARGGQYRALTDWHVRGCGDSETLHGRLELPLAVGTVGGATRSHASAQIALKILGLDVDGQEEFSTESGGSAGDAGAESGLQGARRLSQIVAAVGLAQNLAALRALATTGIQKGHMRLHARQVAVAAGARGEAVERIAGQLIAEGSIRLERAKELLRM